MRKIWALSVLTVLVLSGSALAGTIYGPTPYLSSADSPFTGSFSWFYLEDFEDHLLNVPGVTASAGGVTSVVFGPSIHDSVDADDGTIDGSGLDGDSYFSNPGRTGILFTFNATVLGSLPTHAGIVWTDGAGAISFEAFGPGGSLGTASGSHAGSSFAGETDSDRFYGAYDAGGISSIFISNISGGIEVDHLQYGSVQAVPVPSAGLMGLGLLALLGFRRATRRLRRV